MRCLMFVLLIGQATLLAQQAPPPVFRTSVQLIVQPVSVKDKQGRPIEGLVAADFTILENGEPQEIAFVEYQPIEAQPPASSNAPAADEPMTQTRLFVPLPGDARYRGRRLLVLYIDLSNMSFFDQLRVYAHADRFVSAHMSPADMVAIMMFQDGRVSLKRDFTGDREALGETIEALRTATQDRENRRGSFEDSGGAFGEDNETFALFGTDRQLAGLQTAVTDLGTLPELKTLVYLGGGLRLTGGDNLAQLRATVNAAVRANVTINPIDTRGLEAAPPLGDATQPSPGGIGMFSGALAQASIIRQQQSQDTYYALAKDTGGRAMFDNNDLSLGVVQAARAVTGYYLIGYYTKNVAKDGRFRRVKVALTSRLSADLAYRAGYYGAKDFSRFNAVDKERQLEEALRLEDPITDIPMAMEVNYFQINDAEYFVPLSVRMPGSELTRPRPEGQTRVVIDMIGEIKDDFGVTVRNVKDKLEFTVDAATAADIRRRAIQYETGFTLLPGAYAVKVLARDATTGRLGTFQQSFTIPNLEREQVRLPISTVVLTSHRLARAAALYNVQQKIPSEVANPLVHDGQRLIPSVTRTFRASQPLLVFLEAYERDSATMHPLVAFVTLYSDGGKAFETSPIGLSEGWDPKKKSVPIRLSIALGSVRPGSYVCQITVLNPESRRAAFWRAPVAVIR